MKLPLFLMTRTIVQVTTFFTAHSPLELLIYVLISFSIRMSRGCVKHATQVRQSVSLDV